MSNGTKLFYSKWFNIKFKNMIKYVETEKNDPYLMAQIKTIEQYYDDTCPAIVNIFRDFILPDKDLCKQIKKRNHEYFIEYTGPSSEEISQNEVFIRIHNIFKGTTGEQKIKLMGFINELRKCAIHYDRAEN